MGLWEACSLSFSIWASNSPPHLSSVIYCSWFVARKLRIPDLWSFSVLRPQGSSVLSHKISLKMAPSPALWITQSDKMVFLSTVEPLTWEMTSHLKPATGFEACECSGVCLSIVPSTLPHRTTSLFSLGPSWGYFGCGFWSPFPLPITWLEPCSAWPLFCGYSSFACQFSAVQSLALWISKSLPAEIFVRLELA